ncbi:hypothetical protein Emed_005053 [Eimeria media]
MEEHPPSTISMPSPSLQYSATAQRLVLGVAVLQRECLTSLFCPSPSSNDDAISSMWKEEEEKEEDYGADCMRRVVRMSVGLPDVPPCSFAAFDCLDSPLRAHLPSPEVLQAEEYLAAFNLDSVTDSFTDEEEFRTALERAIKWAASAQHRSRLPPLHCQRLPAILQDLLMQTSSRTLHKHVYELEPEGHLARLRPAGELFLSLLEVCLDIRSKEAHEREALSLRSNPREGDRGETCPLKAALKASRQREEEEGGSLFHAVEKLRKKVFGDLRAQDLRLFLTRLRAESEGLAALKGIARLQPVASLLSLEQLMQRPDLQHLPSFQAPSYEVLREAFYGCLLRCFSLALAHSPSEAQREDWGCMRLISKCREAIRRAGLWEICREELGAAPSRACLSSCCKGAPYLCLARDNEGRNASALLQRRQQQQQQQRLLLLPPERCEATAKALCSFLFPDLRPTSPWLRPPPDPASKKEGGIDLAEEETERIAAISLEGMKGESSEWSGDASTTHALNLHAKLWEQLRALDENLRPSGISAARQRRLHRLLVSWLKRKVSSNAEWLGCRQAAQIGGDALRLVPLLLPYGSSVSGLGAWTSDLDLSLLLPSCERASTKRQGRTFSLQRSTRCVDSERRETDAGNSSSSSSSRSGEACSCCCCSCCAADGSRRGRGEGGRVGLRASRAREAQADVLFRLKEALTADPQMRSAFVDLEVVIPSSAPPVLRGLHLQRKRRRKRGKARVRRSSEAETEGHNASKPLHFLSPSAHSEQPWTGGEMGDGRKPRDSQDRGDNALLLCYSASQPGDSGGERERVDGEAARAVFSSRGECEAGEGLHHQHSREGSEQEDAFNERSLPSQATHRNFTTNDSASATRSPSTQADEESSAQGAGGSVAVKFEVTVGSALGPLNSLLLRAYARRCPLLPPLTRIIKHWADCRGLTGTREGNLSSYAWSLLVIFFALSTSPPLLSNLQGPPFSHSLQQREEGPPLARSSPLCRESLTQTPVEFISRCHSVWFFDADSETPLGSRVADLLRRVFRGSTDALLLQLVQRYVPGHVAQLPPDHTKGGDCLQELANEQRGRGLKRRQQQRRCLRDSELNEDQWQMLASLFYAFFVFYGFHFNCCAILVSLRSPPLCCKRSLNKERHGSKNPEKMKTSTTFESTAAEPPSPSNPQAESLGAAHNNSLKCSTRDGTPSDEAEREEKERGSPKDALHARTNRGAPSPTVCRGNSGEDEWRLIVEGREYRGQREDLVRLLETVTEGGIESARSLGFGIEVEDPMEAGRRLRYKKTKGKRSNAQSIRLHSSRVQR